MRTAFWLSGIAALVIASVLTAQERPGSPRPEVRSARGAPALDEIRGYEIAAHVQFLSDDLLEGRAPSTRGGNLAAKYLAAQLSLIGYEGGASDGTFFQEVPIVETLVDPSFTLMAGPGPPFRFLEDVVGGSGIQEPQVRAAGELVFVGHGIVAPESNWNDYAGADVKGRIVLVMVNDPPATAAEPQLFGGAALTYYGRWTYKFEEAARQGAAGAILIHTDESATYGWPVVQAGWSGTQYAIPAVDGAPRLALTAWVTDRAAREIAKRGGHDLDALRKGALARGFTAVPLGIQASGTINQTVAQRTSPNVIGRLRGTNEREAVIYTAHYDHLGVREPKPGEPADTDRISNGATDNATGLGGVLEIAQAIARARTRPARSIYVLFTTAEESGLLGAAYFADRPVLPPAAWAANINVDSLNMAGPSRDIVLLGAERSSLGAIAAQLAAESGRAVGPDPAPGRGYFFRSDHFPLAKIGVPAVSIGEPIDFVGPDPAASKRFWEEYNAKRYHNVEDEILPSWNYDGAVDDMRFLAELGWRVANLPEKPVYHPNQQFARPRAGTN
jgi:Zn-dependent M28 family amino/carboxypeptidase